MSAQDRELWEYFSTLYKNSNKGIKGRGKDRRISPISKTTPRTKSEERSCSGSSELGSHDGVSVKQGSVSGDDSFDDDEPALDLVEGTMKPTVR